MQGNCSVAILIPGGGGGGHRGPKRDGHVIYINIYIYVIGASLSEPHLVCTTRKFLSVCLSSYVQPSKNLLGSAGKIFGGSGHAHAH